MDPVESFYSILSARFIIFSYIFCGIGFFVLFFLIEICAIPMVKTIGGWNDCQVNASTFSFYCRCSDRRSVFLSEHINNIAAILPTYLVSLGSRDTKAPRLKKKTNFYLAIKTSWNEEPRIQKKKKQRKIFGVGQKVRNLSQKMVSTKSEKTY